MKRTLCWLAAFTGLTFGQTSNGVTVTVSRTVPVPVTQAHFEINADTPAEVPFGEVLLALAGAGVTANDIHSVDTTRALRDGNFNFVPMGDIRGEVTWTFRVMRPSSELASTLGRFAATANEARSASAGRVNMRFQLVGQGPSPADVESARRSVLPQLFEEARTRALGLATAAGTKLDGLSGLNESAVGAVFRAGDFLIQDSISFFRREVTAPTVFQQTFALTAHFAERPLPGTEGVFVTAAGPTLAPTAMILEVTLRGPREMTLAQAVNRLAPLSFTAGDLTRMGLVEAAGSPSRTTWTFARQVQLADLSLALTAAITLKAAIGSSDAFASLDVTAQSLAASEAELEAARARGLSEVAARGRRQAQELARAAGFDIGDLLALSDNAFVAASRFGGLGFGFDASGLNLRFALKK